jgi:hypothetical protein
LIGSPKQDWNSSSSPSSSSSLSLSLSSLTIYRCLKFVVQTRLLIDFQTRLQLFNNSLSTFNYNLDLFRQLWCQTKIVQQFPFYVHWVWHKRWV